MKSDKDQPILLQGKLLILNWQTFLKALGDAILIGTFSIKKISILPQRDLSIQLSSSQKFGDILMILVSSFYNGSMRAKSLQLRLTLGNPVNCSLLGSSIHGIL